MKHRSDILFVYWEYKKLFPLDIKNDKEWFWNNSWSGKTI